MLQFLLPLIYLAFISLGLPDSLLGAAWPVMHEDLSVPVSYAGAISMIIALGTVISSLMSDRLTKRLGAGKVTAISVGTTALALLGFSVSRSFWLLCVLAVPYGLGAGSVDAALNNYVALHYKSRHMSWLHCMWGVGAVLGPYVMSRALLAGTGWPQGYRIIGILQVVLTGILIFSLPLWKKQESSRGEVSPDTEKRVPISLKEVLKIPGAKEIMICFFCYSIVEQTANLWASSYLTFYKGIHPETAAAFASMFFIGITAGRGISGFVTIKLNDTQMIRLGLGIIALGLILMFLPGPQLLSLSGLILIGLGCAPIYPCIIHSTPDHFGADRSQAVIGVQMACAYTGTCLMPPLFGIIAEKISIGLFPLYLLLALLMMVLTHERLLKKTARKETE